MWNVLVILTNSEFKPYDVINDVMRSAILTISNDDISISPIGPVFDSEVGFGGTADRVDLLPRLYQIQDGGYWKYPVNGLSK